MLGGGGVKAEDKQQDRWEGAADRERPREETCRARWPAGYGKRLPSTPLAHSSQLIIGVSPCWVAELGSTLGRCEGWASRKQLEGRFRENTPICRMRRKRSGHWASCGRMAWWGAHGTGLCGGGLFLTSRFLLSAPPPPCATPRAPPASVLDHVFGPLGSLCGALCRAGAPSLLDSCLLPACVCSRCALPWSPPPACVRPSAVTECSSTKGISGCLAPGLLCGTAPETDVSSLPTALEGSEG